MRRATIIVVLTFDTIISHVSITTVLNASASRKYTLTRKQSQLAQGILINRCDATFFLCEARKYSTLCDVNVQVNE
jgi:hypothetical protein